VAEDRSAATWEAQLAPLTRLEFAVSDGAKGIARAVADVARRRAEDDAATPLEQGLDLFHTARDARGLLRRAWRKAETAWERAEAADRALAKARRGGIDARGAGVRAGYAWRRAEAALDQASAAEAAWNQARAGFELFGPDGRLNAPRDAAAELEAAAAALVGSEWSAIRKALRDPRSLAFLGRVHRRLAVAEPEPERREAMAWRWRGRHHRVTSSMPAAGLVQAVAWGRELEGGERASYEAVARVLSGATRASSAVECLHGVLRMQQARHKRMTQAMLDLKRLYWNCRVFGSGPRKGMRPYERLGLSLPTSEFWRLLTMNPVQLMQELSTQRDGP
jgi:hypothetical protein